MCVIFLCRWHMWTFSTKPVFKSHFMKYLILVCKVGKSTILYFWHFALMNKIIINKYILSVTFHIKWSYAFLKWRLLEPMLKFYKRSFLFLLKFWSFLCFIVSFLCIHPYNNDIGRKLDTLAVSLCITSIFTQLCLGG